MAPMYPSRARNACVSSPERNGLRMAWHGEEKGKARHCLVSEECTEGGPEHAITGPEALYTKDSTAYQGMPTHPRSAPMHAKASSIPKHAARSSSDVMSA